LSFDSQRAQEAADDVNLVAIDLTDASLSKASRFASARAVATWWRGRSAGVPFSDLVAESTELST